MNLERSSNDYGPEPGAYKRVSAYCRLDAMRQREPKRRFMGMLALAFVPAFSAALLLVWLVYPGLDRIDPKLGEAALIGVGLILVTFMTIYGSISYSLAFHRPLRLAENAGEQLFYLLPVVEVVARPFGISREQLVCSLDGINSELLLSRLRFASSGRILLLASAELEVKLLRQVRAMAAEYDCDLFAAANSAEARSYIQAKRPATLICVACGKEFSAVVNSLGYRVPLFCISNDAVSTCANRCPVNIHDLRETIEHTKQRFDSIPASPPWATVAQRDSWPTPSA